MQSFPSVQILLRFEAVKRGCEGSLDFLGLEWLPSSLKLSELVSLKELLSSLSFSNGYLMLASVLCHARVFSSEVRTMDLGS